MRGEFPELFGPVDILLTERQRIDDEGAARAPGKTITQKAKKASADAAGFAKKQVIDLKAYHAFAKLGGAAFERYGESAGPSTLVGPIITAIARRNLLDREIAAITSSTNGKWLTSKRLASFVGILAGIALVSALSTGWWSRSPSPSTTQASTDSGTPNTLPSNSNESIEYVGAGSADTPPPDPNGSMEYLRAYAQGYDSAQYWVEKINDTSRRKGNEMVIQACIRSLNTVLSEYHSMYSKAERFVEGSGGSRERYRGMLDRTRGMYEGARAAAGKHAR